MEEETDITADIPHDFRNVWGEEGLQEDRTTCLLSKLEKKGDLSVCNWRAAVLFVWQVKFCA